jgi:hypothetical protein
VNFTEDERTILLEALEQASVRYDEIITDGADPEVEAYLREVLLRFGELAAKLTEIPAEVMLAAGAGQNQPETLQTKGK